MTALPIRYSCASAAVAALVALTGLTGCPKRVPEQDPATLTFDRRLTQQLHCRKQDCSDSFHLEVPEKGELNVAVATSSDTAAERPFTLQLRSPAGHTLDESHNAGAGNAALRSNAHAGSYLVVVSSPTDRKRKPLHYVIQARFVPAPPPPPPPPAEPLFETLDCEVLEVEGRPPEAVLIGRGEEDGLRPGLLGRLVDDGRAIATIEIEDTYPNGSRARITGRLEAAITPATVAEIDVPLEEPEPVGDRWKPVSP